MMMRWVLGVLIVVNVSYFAYQGWHQQGQRGVEITNRPLASSSTIQLLDEAVAMGEAVRIERSAQVENRKAEPVGKLLCTQIGAFQARDSAEQVQQRLMAALIGSEVKEVKVPSAPDFWVYIPPLDNRAAAIRKLKELQANKIDSFVITEGELANGISLGLFSRKNLAEQLRVKHRSSGYDARMKEVDRFRGEYWVEVKRDDRELLSNELWDSIHSRYGFAERFDNLCDGTVASPEEFQ